MSDRLKGKVALVTAAGQGIGRAIAEAFIAEGAMVIATDLAAEKLDGLQAKKCLKLDVPSLEDIEALGRDDRAPIRRARHFGQLRRLCAPGHGARLLRQGLGLFVRPQRQIDAPHDQDFSAGHAGEESGSIVNISSAVSSIRGVPNRYVYGASKAAVIGLTKAVAADFIRQRIRCNAICPGTIASPSLDERIKALSQGDRPFLPRGAAGFCRSPADGPAGNARGGRLPRPLPSERRGKLHYRPGASRPWRDGAEGAAMSSSAALSSSAKADDPVPWGGSGIRSEHALITGCSAFAEHDKWGGW